MSVLLGLDGENLRVVSAVIKHACLALTHFPYVHRRTKKGRRGNKDGYPKYYLLTRVSKRRKSWKNSRKKER